MDSWCRRLDSNSSITVDIRKHRLVAFLIYSIVCTVATSTIIIIALLKQFHNLISSESVAEQEMINTTD
ncbi:unnamed protein product [Brugia pahangi]|uniref:Col_cuticle_N domain-containing protein n=1 Tax=Brugia pahangi TaxID=6280 RepID=A0A0N4T2S5_BRUPA|nr:unnamed protein product [Brugia pahangi]